MQRRILVTFLAAVALLVAPTAASAAPSDRGQQQATGWYLSLGDSLAAGYQLGVDHPTEGYAGPTLAALQQTAPRTKLVNLACSGETTTSMIEGGKCTYEEGSQLDQAVEFLHAHRLTTRLVTLDIGGNDIAKCGFSGLQDSCIDPALATLRQNLPSIMERLHAAAPQAHIVVLNYYDPFLVYALQGPSGLPLAQKSLVVLGTFDGLIAANAAAQGADVADVAGAFSTTSWTPLVPVPGIGSVPLNLARILMWTWMAPPRLDFHANDTGYAVMAGAVIAEL
jgi:lysophospholipase L1-like esterase